jgi:hypothetical protein
MDELFGRARWMLVLRGAAGLLFGMLALFWPGLTLLLLIAMFAAYSLVGGAAAISRRSSIARLAPTGGCRWCAGGAASPAVWSPCWRRASARWC